MTNPQVALENRRGTVEQARSATAQRIEVEGTTPLGNIGEALVTVDFGRWFIEKPSIAGAGEMFDNEPLEAGNYPTWSVGVFRWVTRERAGSIFYTGAQLVLVSTGRSGMRSFVHWQVKGLALRNPVGS